jgi:hypothetical protein
MDPLSVPVGTGLPDPKAAEALAARAEGLSETLDKLIANLNHASAEARERIAAEKSGVVPSIGGAADRATIADAVARAIDRDHRALHAELARSSERDRYAQLREAQEKAAALESLVTVYASPVAYLSGTTVGNPRRNEYAATVADAGPAELQVFAARAVASGDRDLAAAVVARLGRMSKESRPLEAAALAEKLVGQEHAGLVHAAKRAAAAAQRAVNVNRAFERGQPGPSATSKIAQGLRHRAVNPTTTDPVKVAAAMPGRK